MHQTIDNLLLSVKTRDSSGLKQRMEKELAFEAYRPISLMKKESFFEVHNGSYGFCTGIRIASFDTKVNVFLITSGREFLSIPKRRESKEQKINEAHSYWKTTREYLLRAVEETDVVRDFYDQWARESTQALP